MAGCDGAGFGCSGMNLDEAGNPGFLSNMGGRHTPPEPGKHSKKAGSGRFRVEMSSQRREQWRRPWGLGMASSQQLPADRHHL